MNEKGKNKSAIKKTKVIGVSIFIAVAFIISIFTCFKLYLNTNVENHLKLEEIISRNQEALIEYQDSVEYGTIWKYDDFITKLIDKNKMVQETLVTITLDGNKIETDDEYIFDALVEHELTIELNYDYRPGKDNHQNIKNNKDYLIKVVDTTPPIINGLEDKTIAEGTHIDLKEGITAFDNVDGEVAVVINPETIISKVGTYKIEVSATDSKGNIANGEFIVNIVPKIMGTTQTTTTTSTTTTTKKTTTTTKKKTTVAEVNDSSTKSGRLYLAKQEAKRVVKEIIKPGMTDEEKAYAIYLYLHTNVALQNNQSSEAYKSNYGNEAYAALVMKIAACSGFCKAVTLLCDEAGLQSQHVNANLWIHQWNRVLINGEWIVLDAQGGIFGGTTHPLE